MVVSLRASVRKVFWFSMGVGSLKLVCFMFSFIEIITGSVVSKNICLLVQKGTMSALKDRGGPEGTIFGKGT